MKILQMAVYIVGVVGLILSIFQYRRNSQRERSRWLFELYQKFYERTEFKRMRLQMEEGNFSLSALDSESAAHADDYFNFSNLSAI